MKEITFITSNTHKAKQLQNYLKIPVKQKNISLDEIQSLDLKEILEHKAKEAFKRINSPVLVEDVSLTINALGKLPGPFIKWFESEIGLDKICQIVNLLGIKTATVEILYGIYDGNRFTTIGASVEGTIAQKPKGKKGFGFDAIFIPKGYTQTRGEMDDKDFDGSSHRRQALEKVQEFLTNSLN